MTRYYDVTLERDGRQQRLSSMGITPENAGTFAVLQAWIATGFWWTVARVEPMNGADVLWDSYRMGAGGVL